MTFVEKRQQNDDDNDDDDDDDDFIWVRLSYATTYHHSKKSTTTQYYPKYTFSHHQPKIHYHPKYKHIVLTVSLSLYQHKKGSPLRDEDFIW